MNGSYKKTFENGPVFGPPSTIHWVKRTCVGQGFVDVWGPGPTASALTMRLVTTYHSTMPHRKHNIKTVRSRLRKQQMARDAHISNCHYLLSD